MANDRNAPIGPAGFVMVWMAAGVAAFWVAGWNGYPIIFGDTYSYLASALSGAQLNYRPSAYTVVMLLAAGTGSLWAVALLQGAVAAWLLTRFLRVAIALPAAGMVAALIAIGAVTTFGWWPVTVMTGVWCPIAALALYLLLYCWPRLGAIERIVLFCVFGFALLVHVSYFMVFALWLVLLVGLHALGRFRIAAPRRALLGAWAAVVGAGLFFPALGLVLDRDFVPSTKPETIVAARMIADGLIAPTLDARCAARRDAACAHRAALRRWAKRAPPPGPRNKWPCPCSAEGFVVWALMWDKGSPLKAIEQAPGGRAILRELIASSIRREPLHHIAVVAGGTIDLYLNGAITPYIDGNPGNGGFLTHLLPADWPQFRTSRSARGTLETARFNRVLDPVIWIGTVIGLGFLVLGLVRPSGIARLGPRVRGVAHAGPLLLLFCLSNAAVVYALVGDHTRYQSRISWLVGLIPIVLIAALLDGRARRG